eukprot:741911-Rhodomonas_salina.1
MPSTNAAGTAECPGLTKLVLRSVVLRTAGAGRSGASGPYFLCGPSHHGPAPAPSARTPREGLWNLLFEQLLLDTFSTTRGYLAEVPCALSFAPEAVRSLAVPASPLRVQRGPLPPKLLVALAPCGVDGAGRGEEHAPVHPIPKLTGIR